MAKIENIADLKKAQENAVQAEMPTITAEEYFGRLMTEERRVEVSQKIDTFLKENQLGFEEALLGFSDYGISVLVRDMVTELKDDKEEILKLDERFAATRTTLAKALNSSDTLSMGESIVALLSFVTESIGIIAEDAVRTDKEVAGE